MTLKRVVIGLSLCLGLATTATGQDLKPRTPTKRVPTDRLQIPDQPTGNLTIKFTDDCLVRENGGVLNSLANANLNPVLAVAREYDLRFTKAINKSDEALMALQQRAAALSGYAQPDLAGMMSVEVPGQHLLDAAQALNDLTDHVEWVRIDYVPKLPGYNMFGGDPECGDMGTGDCYDPDGTGSPFCEDTVCCDLICDVDPFCCDVEWDGFCAANSNLFCGAGDNCVSGLNESCFEVHSTGGCNNETCCNAVCDIDTFCCDADWDASCVGIATEECLASEGSGQTPDWTDLQGYTNVLAYADLPGGAPGELSAPAPNLFGFTGEGWDLQGFEDFCQNLYDVYGMDASGEGVVVKGENQNIAVIEWAFYRHEDLSVRLEPGQTMIVEPDITEPDHATACLGILNAQDNGFGMTGIVPEAQAWFFPLTSVEEGARELTAWTSCLETLGWGDVVSCSYGPGPPIGNLNNDTAIATLIALARDLGITVCVAAGNDCYNLDDAPDTWDEGVDNRAAPGCVVGAGSPGAPYYRLPFSNHYTDPDDGVRSNVVHIQAWGMSTAATGYGDVFFPNQNTRRSYTSGFSGTSSACPQVAGLILAFQGLAKQVHGNSAPPDAARNNVAVGRTQGGGNPRFTGGFNPDLGCGFDSDPDEGPNTIGPYTVLVGGFGSAASGYLNNGPAAESEYLHEIYPTLGEVVGAVQDALRFMVQSDDEWFIQIQSEPGSYDGGSNTPGGAPPEIGDVLSGTRVWGFGDVSQFLIHYRTELPLVETMTMSSNCKAPPDSIHIGEAWNFAGARWDFVAAQGFSGLNGNAWQLLEGDAFFPQDNWRQLTGDNGFLSCFQLDTVLSFGFDQGGIEPGHLRELDFVDVEIGPIP